MAQAAIFLVISLFFNPLSLFFLPSISSKPNSFTLKLIHRDSPLSPLYRPNISDFEHIEKNEQISESRSLFFLQMYEGETENSKISKNTTIRQPLKYDDFLITVELGIGTPTVQQTLIFDTANRITWIQCTPCFKCFTQNEPLFNTGESSSYSRISKTDNLVKEFTCIFSYCFYYVRYDSGQSSSSGLVSKENFTFKTSTGTTDKAELVFGCGMKNEGSYSPSISGILGMNKHPVSFSRQLGRHIKSRFSYCFPTMNNNRKASVLRLGEEAIIRTRNKKSLPFFNSNNKSFHYALNLTDISIGGERLRLGPYAFSKGCILDTGSPISMIEQKTYYSVAQSFERYFSKFNNVRRVTVAGTTRLCYSYTGSFNSFPNMTFHFQGADLNIRPENVVIDYRRSMFFCLAVTESRSFTFLGAFQQQNTRFVYDLDRDMLSFAQEDCSKDVAA